MRYFKFSIAVLFITFLLFFPPNLIAATYNGKVIKVIDGNKLVAKVSDKEVTLRLSDIDAPELEQKFGAEAKQYSEKLTLNKTVRINCLQPIKANTKIINAQVFSPNVMDALNENLVRQGLAFTIKKKGMLPPYSSAENLAKKKKIGVWSQSVIVTPSEHREKIATAKAEQAAKAAKDKAKKDAEWDEKELADVIAKVDAKEAYENSPEGKAAMYREADREWAYLTRKAEEEERSWEINSVIDKRFEDNGIYIR